jgi:hypothetical protein
MAVACGKGLKSVLSVGKKYMKVGVAPALVVRDNKEAIRS